MEIFRSITPLVEPLSLDEAFLDVAGRGPPARPAAPRSAQLIRDRVADEQGITCSVGVATHQVRRQARLRPAASPTACSSCPADGVVAFLHPLPVGALWGVGEKTEEELTRLGLRTVGDIAHTPRAAPCVRALGQAAGAHLHALAWGRDERRVVPHEPDKSIGAEETFARDVDDPDGRPPRAAAAVRADRRPAARRRAGRAHRQRQGPVRRLHHDHPGHARCPRPPTSRRTSTPPPGSSTRRSGWTGPGSGWSASGSRGSVESEHAPRQLLLGRAGPGLARGRAGGGPGGPAVRRRDRAPGQPGRSATRRRRTETAHAESNGFAVPGFITPLVRISFLLTCRGGRARC